MKLAHAVIRGVAVNVSGIRRPLMLLFRDARLTSAEAAAVRKHSFIAILARSRREGAALHADYRDRIRDQAAAGWKLEQAIMFDRYARPGLGFVFTRKSEEMKHPLRLPRSFTLFPARLLALLVLAGNFMDHDSNYQFEKRVLSMGTTFEDDARIWGYATYDLDFAIQLTEFTVVGSAQGATWQSDTWNGNGTTKRIVTL